MGLLFGNRQFHIQAVKLNLNPETMSRPHTTHEQGEFIEQCGDCRAELYHEVKRNERPSQLPRKLKDVMQQGHLSR
jgi:hypothetical protein